MACPDCGCPSGEFRFATSIETHGLDCGPFERFDEEFIVCRGCGGRFDPRDWEETEEAPHAALEGVYTPGDRDDASISELGSPDLAAAAAAAAAVFERGRSFNVQTGSEDTL
jgi:hypothetical protein